MPRARRILCAVVRVEFTIEPFVEGAPGAHVLAAVDAARAFADDVELGPFGSSCTTEATRAGDLVRAIVDSAIVNGATHVSLHVERSR